MLLPAKHIRVSESIIGLSSFILSKLNKPRTIDSLWSEFKYAVENKKYPSHHSVENLVLAIDFLYIIGLVNVNDDGEVFQ